MTAQAVRRPTQDRRRALILRAAGEIFFEQGYASTSIDAIIDRVGGSKRDIYAEFRNKEGLFTALVTESANEALAVFDNEDFSGRNLQETLLEFASRLLTLYMTPALLGVYRSVVTEARRFPHLAQTFYANGPERAAKRLATVLKGEAAANRIVCADPTFAAHQFVGMIRGNLHLQVVLALRPPPSSQEIEKAVSAAVDIFLHGLQKRRQQR